MEYHFILPFLRDQVCSSWPDKLSLKDRIFSPLYSLIFITPKLRRTHFNQFCCLRYKLGKKNWKEKNPIFIFSTCILKFTDNISFFVFGAGSLY